jgi:hypothetical protein
LLFLGVKVQKIVENRVMDPNPAGIRKSTGLLDPDLYFLSRIKETEENKFNILSFLMVYCTHIFPMATKMSGSS